MLFAPVIDRIYCIGAGQHRLTLRWCSGSRTIIQSQELQQQEIGLLKCRDSFLGIFVALEDMRFHQGPKLFDCYAEHPSRLVLGV